jgi:hypothetical protein
VRDDARALIWWNEGSLIRARILGIMQQSGMNCIVTKMPLSDCEHYAALKNTRLLDNLININYEFICKQGKTIR